MMKFELVSKKMDDGTVQECVVFEDGTVKKVKVHDETGKKYFCIDNKLNTKYKGWLGRRFSGRIKDAVDTVTNGDGDVIITHKIGFGSGNHIVEVGYFIDREFGEEIKKKSIEGWKNAKFAYSIMFGNKNSFSGYSKVNIKGEKINPFNDENETIITFETEEEAEKYMEKSLSKAASYAKDLSNKCVDINGNNDPVDSVVEEILNQIKKDTKSESGIIEDMVFDMVIEDNGSIKLKSDNCSLDNYGYKIIQCVIKDGEGTI